MKGANISIINLHLKMAFSPHLIGWDEINFHIQSPNFGSFSTRSVKLCCGSSFVALLCQGLGIPYMLGLPKPCNFTVGKNNRSLFHVLRDLYSPSAKSSVYHQCLGINTQHRLFAKIFWKAREFSCSISELWMSSVRVHWECLFPFLFCFWKMWCLFFFFQFFSLEFWGWFLSVYCCFKMINIYMENPLSLPPGPRGPQLHLRLSEDQESLVQFLVQPGVAGTLVIPRWHRWRGWWVQNPQCVYRVSKKHPRWSAGLGIFSKQQQYHWYHWY